MKPYRLLPSHEQALRDQDFDANHPGTLLRDIQTVLDFIGTEKVKASGKHGLLPPDAIKTLDQSLSWPLRLPRKRFQPSSHPYLQGLHLLLRATGLVGVEGGGTGARLVLDPDVRGLWEGLNPAERYFTLLEAWLLVGRP